MGMRTPCLIVYGTECKSCRTVFCRPAVKAERRAPPLCKKTRMSNHSAYTELWFLDAAVEQQTRRARLLRLSYLHEKVYIMDKGRDVLHKCRRNMVLFITALYES